MRTTRSQMIVRRLKEGILEGLYAGGMRMNEIELAEALEVSRTPIRAALSILATEGLLKYTPNSGFVVQRFTSADIEQIYEVRAALAGLAARLATEAGLGEEEMAKLRRVIEECQRLLDKHDWSREHLDKWSALNEEFHDAIDDATRNPHLLMAIQRTKDIPILNEIRFRWIDPSMLEQNHFDHIEIVDAIVSRKQVRAEDVTREHVYRNGRRIVHQWRRIEARKDSKTDEQGGPDSGADNPDPGRETASLSGI